MFSSRGTIAEARNSMPRSLARGRVLKHGVDGDVLAVSRAAVGGVAAPLLQAPGHGLVVAGLGVGVQDGEPVGEFVPQLRALAQLGLERAVVLQDELVFELQGLRPGPGVGDAAQHLPAGEQGAEQLQPEREPGQQPAPVACRRLREHRGYIPREVSFAEAGDDVADEQGRRAPRRQEAQEQPEALRAVQRQVRGYRQRGERIPDAQREDLNRPLREEIAAEAVYERPHRELRRGVYQKEQPPIHPPVGRAEQEDPRQQHEGERRGPGGHGVKVGVGDALALVRRVVRQLHARREDARQPLGAITPQLVVYRPKLVASAALFRLWEKNLQIPSFLALCLPEAVV